MPKRRAANGAGTIVERADGRFQGAIRVLTPTGMKRRAYVYGKSRTEVHGKLQALSTKTAQGIPHASHTPTVERWLNDWLNTVVSSRNRPRTLERYREITHRYLVPLLGSNRLDHLSVLHVQSAIDQLSESGTGPRTIQQVRSVLSAALSRAQRAELVHRNVARLVELPRYEPKEIQPWTEDQARHFLAAVSGHAWEIGYTLLLVYGLRRGEAVGLRWSDVDLESGVIRVRQQLQRIDGRLVAGEVKTSAGRRTLPIVSALRELLLARAKAIGLDTFWGLPDELILTSQTGSPVDPHNFTRTFQSMREAVGLPRITVHHTRHTAATLLKSFGVQARDVQLILGHANVTTTQQLYQHGRIDEHRVMLDQVATALAPAPEEATSEDTQVSARADGCQVHHLGASEDIDEDARQGQFSNENRRSTEVRTADFDGGSDGARTHDTLLKSSIQRSLATIPTPVVRELLARSRMHLVGAMVVNLDVKNLDSRSERLAELRSERRAIRSILTEQLRTRSFPYALVPQLVANSREAA